MMAQLGWLISDHVVSPPGSKLVLDHLVAAAVVARPARGPATVYRCFSGCSLGQVKARDYAKSQHGGHYQMPGYRWWEQIQSLLQLIYPNIQESLGGDQSTEQVCPRY